MIDIFLTIAKRLRYLSRDQVVALLTVLLSELSTTDFVTFELGVEVDNYCMKYPRGVVAP